MTPAAGSLGTYLIFGSSGPLGAKVVEAISRRGGRARGLVRSEAGAAQAREAGAVDIALADIRDEAAVEDSLRGCDGAFFFCPRAEPDEASIGRAFIAAAERAGVPRIAYVSMLNAEALIPNHMASLEVERALGMSNLEYTILRSGMFMQNLPRIEQIAEDGWVGRPYPVDAPLAVIDQYDLAEVAALSLTEDKLVNGNFELCAPGVTSFTEIAKLATEALGTPIQPREITLDEWAEVKGEGFGSPYRRETYIATFKYITDHGFGGGNGFVLSQILGREPTSFEHYFARGGRPPWIEAAGEAVV
jgi:uncharacterized protein YbjT (DUF2867 family)